MSRKCRLKHHGESKEVYKDMFLVVLGIEPGTLESVLSSDKRKPWDHPNLIQTQKSNTNSSNKIKSRRSKVFDKIF